MMQEENPRCVEKKTYFRDYDDSRLRFREGGGRCSSAAAADDDDLAFTFSATAAAFRRRE